MTRHILFAFLSATFVKNYKVLAFVKDSHQPTFRPLQKRNVVVVQAADTAPGDDIIAKAREKAGAVQQEEKPSLFEDSIRTDIREALFKLERRVQEGPEALSVLEVEQLEGELRRITVEMKENQHKKAPRPTRSTEESTTSEGSTTNAAAGAEPSTAFSLLHAEPGVIASLKERRPTEKIEDTSMDEGPAWEGHGGMGQPRGTVNTYIIPGMDEMTPEEYRDALQRSVIERQARRKAAGVTGNRSSADYLKTLGG